MCRPCVAAGSCPWLEGGCACHEGTLIRHDLRSCLPTPFGLRPFPPDRGNRPSPLEGEGFQAADSRPYEETGAFRNIGRGRSQTGPRAATWGRPYWVTFSQRKAFGRPQGSPLRISKNGGRVWDPPLQKTKPFRVCRRGRTLAGPPGNGTRLGRAAQCAAPTKKRERSGISVGAGPRPARGRTLCAPTVETVCPYNQGRSPHPSRLRRATFP